MEKVQVTFIFDSDESFHHFLEDNKIDVYTYNWRKHTYLVDLTSEVKSSMEAVGAIKKDDQPPKSEPVAKSESEPQQQDSGAALF